MIRILTAVASGLAVAALAAGFAVEARWLGAGVIMAIGVAWWAGQWRGWAWPAAMGLVCCTTAAALGLWLQLGAGWMLLGATAALSAWEMDHLGRWLERASCPAPGKPKEQVEQGPQLIRRHVRRLLLVDGIGLLVAAIALQAEAKLSLGVMLLLGLLAIVGLNRAVVFLQRQD